MDRQLEMFSGTRLEWWSSGTSRSDGSRAGNRRKTTTDIEVNILDHESDRQSSGAVDAVSITGRAHDRAAKEVESQGPS